MSLDNYDRKILTKLTENGRITWRDLADEIGLSLTPTIRRVKHLENAGYITGYFARLDEKVIAGEMSVFVSVTLDRQIRESLDDFEAQVVQLPEVMSAFMMSGGSDYLLRCVVKDLTHYRDLLDEITKIPCVSQIQSSFALKTIINRAAPILTNLRLT
ncbi:MAG TPA: Lrp/AsnC family transcriptional regulator [Novosphingobium sp.]